MNDKSSATRVLDHVDEAIQQRKKDFAGLAKAKKMESSRSYVYVRIDERTVIMVEESKYKKLYNNTLNDNNMKMRTKEQTAKVSINEAALLFKNYDTKVKEAAKLAKEYKEILLKYAKDNPAAFDGKTLKFSNGVRIELRESDEHCWNKGAVDYEWVGDAITAGLGEAIVMSLNVKSFPAKLNKAQKKLLKDIELTTEKSTSYAVYADK